MKHGLEHQDLFRYLELRDYFIKEVRTDLHINMNDIVKMWMYNETRADRGSSQPSTKP